MIMKKKTAHPYLLLDCYWAICGQAKKKVKSKKP